MGLGLGGGLGLNNFGFGRIGNWKYGGIGSWKKSNILGIPVNHWGGLYSNKLLLAPNPSEAENVIDIRVRRSTNRFLISPLFQMEGGPMLGNPQQQQPLYDDMFVGRAHEDPQMVYYEQQQQQYQDPGMARQWSEQPAQGLEYGYENQGMVAAENPNENLEEEQGRFWNKVSE